VTSSRFLDQLSLGLLFTHLLLRVTVAAVDPVWGTNLLIHGLVWPAAAMWCLARLLEGRTPLRLTGLEIPIVAWGVLCVVSIQRSTYKLAAIDTAVAFATLAALVPIIVHVAGPGARRLLTTFFHATTAGIAVYAVLQVLVFLPMLRSSPDAQQFIARLGDERNEFVTRLMGNQPWGTFISPNSLAGFLVLALPFAAGSIADAWRAKERPMVLITVRAITVVAGIVALVMTGSKGAWGAMAVAIGAAAVLFLAHKRPGKRRMILAVGLGILLVGLIGGWLVTSTRVKSMQFRAEYAKAAMSAFKTEPVMGIGLGQYADAQPRYKSDLQQETQKTHNDYLQILCELGILGLLAFLAMIGMSMRHALSGSVAPVPAPPADEARSWLPAAAGAGAALIVGFFLKSDSMMTLSFGAVWAVAFFAARPHEPEEPVFSRLGLAAGFIGILAHLTVDFDLYEYGVAASLFTAIALLVLYARPPSESDGGRLLAGAGAAVTLLIAVPLTWGALKFQRAEELLERAKEHFENRQDELANAVLVKAHDVNPFDPALCASVAGAQMMSWRNLAEKTDFSDVSLRVIADKEVFALTAFERTIVLRPDHAPYRYAIASAHEEFARFYQRASLRSRQPDLPGKGRIHNADAELNYRKAIELYPTRAYFHAALAALLDAMGKEDFALAEYRLALRYSELAFDTPRLQLPPFEHARALCRLGRAGERRVVDDLTRVLVDYLAAKMTQGPKLNIDELLTVIDNVRKEPTLLRIDFHPSMQAALDMAAVDTMNRARQNDEEERRKAKESQKTKP